jgi:hypothetical protein
MRRQVYAELRRPQRRTEDEILLSNEGWRIPKLNEKVGETALETLVDIDEVLAGNPGEDPDDELTEFPETD